MSDVHDNPERLDDAEPEPTAPEEGREERVAPASPAGGEGARAGEARKERPPVKVVDRRFWARGEAGGAEEPSPPSTRPTVLQEMQGRLEETQERLREVLVATRRMQEGNEEFRERMRRDLERRVSLAKAALFRDLLEVADNLERALAAAGSGSSTADLLRGVEQVLAQLRRLLAAQGVEEVEVAGLPFDPEVAEAVEVREVPEASADGTVIEVTQRGYRYAGQTLRPARVIVGRAPGRAAGGGE